MHPSICSHFQMTSSEASGPILLKFLQSLLRLGEQKIAKMVVVRWPRWPPCPYMVKTFKNLLLQKRMPWGWIFAQFIRDGRYTKVAKMMVVYWPLTFLWRGQVCFPMHLYGHHTFVWEKCWEFQTTSPLKPLGQCCSYFMWCLLRMGEQKIAKWLWSIDQDGCYAHIW